MESSNIDPDACELVANQAKCVNDKDPELMQEIIRYEDTNYPVWNIKHISHDYNWKK